MKEVEVELAWSDVWEGCRLRWVTPGFVKRGTLLRRKNASAKIQFDGETRPTVMPDARWYFAQWKLGNREEYLVAIEGDAPASSSLAPRDDSGDAWDSPSCIERDFGVPQKQLRKWLREGKIMGKQEQGRWSVERSSVERFLSER